MFDEKLKSEFVTQYVNPRPISEFYVENVIDAVSKTEDKNGKRCNEFTRDEILEMYSNQNFISTNMGLRFHAVVKAYVAFLNFHLVGHGDLGQYDNIIGTDISITPRKLYTREDITNVENELKNLSDMAIIECLWEGVTGSSMSDLLALSWKHVDFDKHVIKIDGRIYPMTTLLERRILDAFRETTYITYGKRPKVMDVQGGIIVKQVKQTPAPQLQVGAIRSRMRLFKQQIGVDEFTTQTVIDSGFVYNSRCIMKKLGLDIRSFVSSPEGKNLIARYGYRGKFASSNAMKKLNMLL